MLLVKSIVRSPAHLFEDIARDFRKNFLPFKEHYVFWIAIVIASAIRTFYLSEPMRTDEASSALNYIVGNPLRVFYYSGPNNHVLYSITTKVTTTLMGNDLVGFRFPSFFSGIGSLFLIYRICRRFGNNGNLSVFLFAFWPSLILYSTNGRGYSLSIFISLIIITLIQELTRFQDQVSLIKLSIVNALYLFAIPSNLFSLAGLLVWIGFASIRNDSSKIKDSISKLTLVITCTILATCILYLPVVIMTGGVGKIIGNKDAFHDVVRLPWDQFGKEYYQHIIESFHILTLGLPSFILYLISILIFIGLFSYFYRRAYLAILLIPSLIIGSNLIIISTRVLPYERTWIYLLPIAFVFADEGCTYLFARLRIIRLIRITLLSLMLFVLTPRYVGGTFRSTINSIDPGSLPDAPSAIKFLKGQIIDSTENYNIIVGGGLEASIAFYNWYFRAPFYINGLKIRRIDNFADYYDHIKSDFAKFMGRKPRSRDLRNNNEVKKLKQIIIIRQNEGDISDFTSKGGIYANDDFINRKSNLIYQTDNLKIYELLRN